MVNIDHMYTRLLLDDDLTRTQTGFEKAETDGCKEKIPIGKNKCISRVRGFFHGSFASRFGSFQALSPIQDKQGPSQALFRGQYDKVTNGS